MLKLKNKKNIIIMITLITMLIGLFAPVMNVLAVKDDANQKLNEEIGDYVGDSENFTDVIEIMQKDSKNNPNPDKNTILHIMKRLFAPGEYLNDVEYSVLSNKFGISRSDVLYKDRYLCNPNAPNNLINHNCNIPNFTTDLAQNIMSPLSTPFNGAGKTSSYATFGFGVPKDIPGGLVPINPEHRINTYTALELYGYSLPLISYNGEWDKIDISSEARMLSNFGLIDKVTLMGTGLWNSIKSGIGTYIENFSFNPFRWSTNIAKTFEGLLTGGINTVIDTSDLNIVATNAWKRPSFSSTLYNVYVLTDKEVLIETNKKYFRKFIEKLENKANVSPELLEVLALEQIPPFTFDPLWETDESIAAREAAMAHNDRESSLATSDPEYSPSYVPIPEPIYYTEPEQLVFWSEEPDNADIIKRAAAQGLISADSSKYIEYEILVESWNSAWTEYFSREFNALGEVVDNLVNESDLEVFLENPHLDPKQGISHYACANPDGSIMKNNGNIEYLYLKNNKGEQEFLNPKCSLARPPISGGLMGSGWLKDKPGIDTRHISSVQEGSIGVQGSGSVTKSIGSFLAQLTNTVIGLAFQPLISELGIDTIVSQLVEGFRDTLFFPLAGLLASIGALLLFFKLLKDSSAWQLLTSIAITFLTFVIAATFLLYPGATLRLVDTVPSAIENYLATAVLIEDDGTSYCSTGGEADGIRSAQCNVWGMMVFNPWIHLQFGDKYENLFANGYAPADGADFKNTNSDLVGNAEVNMGGGKILNNWAIYQLDKTKAGTINNTTFSSLMKVGSVDKDLYKMVDLQAGPNNGAGTDSTHFRSWSGHAPSKPLGFIFFIETLLVSFTLISISFLKVEASFVFAISIIFLPIVLLYGLLPQGRDKLKGYLSSLVSLLLKRSIITIMLVVLLKIYTLSYAMTASATNASLIAIAVSIAFLIYKKEILSIIVGSENSKIKEMIADIIPNDIKNSYRMKTAEFRGTVSGFAGGAIGVASYKRKANKDIKIKQSEIEELNNLSNSRSLSTEENETLNNLKEELQTAEEKKDFLNDKEQGAFSMGMKGVQESRQIIGRRAERSIRKQGFTAASVYKNAKEEVIMKGADKITNKEESTASDTYREVLSHSESNISKTSQKMLTKEEARLLKTPKIQKEIRRLAKERGEISEANKDNKNHTAKSLDIDELDKIAKYIDRKRKVNKVKGNLTNRYYEKNIIKPETDEKRSYVKVDSNVKDIIKEEIEKEKIKEQKEKEEKRGE